MLEHVMGGQSVHQVLGSYHMFREGNLYTYHVMLEHSTQGMSVHPLPEY